jgi:hypothetical protein
MVGTSSTLPHLADHVAMGVFDVFQIPYSAVEREHEAVITAAAQSGAGIVIRGGAAKGAPTEGKHEGVQWESRLGAWVEITYNAGVIHRGGSLRRSCGGLPVALCRLMSRRCIGRRTSGKNG